MEEQTNNDKLNEGLTLAQIFRVKVLEDELNKLPADKLRPYLIELIRQQYRQANLFKDILKGTPDYAVMFKKDSV
jgi:hypothetical protein